MTNNDIFKKLRVALQLRDDQIVEILELVDFRISKAELGAFFRAEDHPNYLDCGDQVLRNFLNGLIIHLRGTKENPKNPAEVIKSHKPSAGNREIPAAKKDFQKNARQGYGNDKKTFSSNKKNNNSSQKDDSKFIPKHQVVEKVKFNNGKNKKFDK